MRCRFCDRSHEPASLAFIDTLFFQRRDDLTLHVFGNGVPHVGILNHLVGIEPSGRCLDFQRDGRLLIWFNRDCLLNVVPNIGMPDLDGIGARWDIGEFESPLLVGNREIWMVGDQRPALHVRMETALHAENLPVFRHLHPLGHGGPFVVLVKIRAQPGSRGYRLLIGSGTLNKTRGPRFDVSYA